jgi:hypothetical protein
MLPPSQTYRLLRNVVQLSPASTSHLLPWPTIARHAKRVALGRPAPMLDVKT